MRNVSVAGSSCIYFCSICRSNPVCHCQPDGGWGEFMRNVSVAGSSCIYFCSICRSDPVCDCQPRWWVGSS